MSVLASVMRGTEVHNNHSFWPELRPGHLPRHIILLVVGPAGEPNVGSRGPLDDRGCGLRGGCWRSGRDSNPRYGFAVYSLSRRAPSTTRPPLRIFAGRGPSRGSRADG